MCVYIYILQVDCRQVEKTVDELKDGIAEFLVFKDVKDKTHKCHKCDKCNRTFVRKDNLKRHLKICGRRVKKIEAKDVCDKCKKKFSTDSNRIRHSKICKA